MDASEKITRINDNGGTRCGTDRRKYSNMDNIHERRSGKERRKEIDRRRNQNFRGERAIERRELFR